MSDGMRKYSKGNPNIIPKESKITPKVKNKT
jgi:hypothetical protein